MKFKLALALFACFSTVIAPPVFSQVSLDTTVSITLEDAVISALENNPNIVIQRAEVKITEENIRRSRAAFEPVLSARVSYNRLEHIPLDSLRRYNEGQIGINQRTPFGTNIAVSSTITSDYEDSPRRATHTAGLSITQALLEGMPISVNTANIKRARIDTDMSQQRLEFLSARIISETQRAFWNYVLAKREFEIVKRNSEVIASRLARVQTEFEIGAASRIDLAQIKAEAAGHQKKKIDAQSSKNVAKLNLLHITGKLSVTNRNASVKIDNIPDINWFQPDAIEEHIEAAIKFRQDIKEAQLLVERNEVTLVETRNGLLPKLDFFIELSATSYASSFANTDVLGNPDMRRFSTGLSLNLPVLKTDARARHSQSKYRVEQSNSALLNMKNLVILDITRAHSNVESAIQLIEATQKSFEARELFFNMQTEKFEMNQIPAFEYLQSARDFMQSELELERAKISYILALTELYFFDGTLLRREGF